MAFEFRYQRVLEVREIEEQVEQAELGRIQRRLTEEKNRLDELESELGKTFNKLRGKRMGRVGAQYFLQVRSYLDLLGKRLSSQRKKVETWTKKVKKQREKLIEASQEKQVFERLKDREYKRFKEELLRSEQKENNEIGTRSFFRQNRSDMN